MKLVYESPEQWELIKRAVLDGMKPCPVCGEFAQNLYKIPSRLRPYIRAWQSVYNDMFREKVTIGPYFACDRCMASMCTRRNAVMAKDWGKCYVCKSDNRISVMNKHKFTTVVSNRLSEVYSGGGLYYDKGNGCTRHSFSVCNRCNGEFLEVVSIIEKYLVYTTPFNSAKSTHRQRDPECNDIHNDIEMTFYEWCKTLEYFNDKCAYCGKEWGVHEHFIPIVDGGKFEIGNLLPSCQSCNMKKRHHNDKLQWVYREYPDNANMVNAWVNNSSILKQKGQNNE